MAVPRRTAAASRGILGGSALLNSFRDLERDQPEPGAVSVFGEDFQQQPSTPAPDVPRPPPRPLFSPGRQVQPSTPAPLRLPTGDKQFGVSPDFGKLVGQLPPLQGPGLDLYLPQSPSLQNLNDLLTDRFNQQSLLEEQMIEARNLNAFNATASYAIDLQILGREIAELTDGQAVNNGLWDRWASDANDTITESVRKTQAAYTEYIRLLNQNFDAFDALNKSRFNEFAAVTNGMIQEWMDKTGSTYEDFKDQLPGFWGPAIDAIVEGNIQALGDIAQNTEESKATIEGHLVEQSDILREELDKIAGDNPQLHAALMRDMTEDMDLMLESVTETGRATEAIQTAAGAIGENVARGALAQGMREIEEQRLTVINDAARQRHQILTASDARLDEILEQSGLSRAQILIDIEGNLKAALQNFDDMRTQIRLDGERGAENMAFSVNETLQDLFDSQRRFVSARDVTLSQIDLTLKQSREQLWATDTDPLELGRMLGYGLADEAGLPSFAGEELTDGLVEFITARFVDTPIEFQNYLNRQADFKTAWNTARSQLGTARASGDDLAIEAAEKNLAVAERESDEFYRKYEPEMTSGIAQTIFEGIETTIRTQTNPTRRPAWSGDYDPSMITAFGQLGAPRDHAGVGQGHNGIDINLPAGTPITATVSGHIQIFPLAGDAGNMIVLKGDDGLWYRYLHLDSFTVEMGQRVEAGEQIAVVGDTGNSSAIHLHFEVRKGGAKGEVMDPMAALFGQETESQDVSAGFSAFTSPKLTGLADFTREKVTSTRARFLRPDRSYPGLTGSQSGLFADTSKFKDVPIPSFQANRDRGTGLAPLGTSIYVGRAPQFKPQDSQTLDFRMEGGAELTDQSAAKAAGSSIARLLSTVRTSQRRGGRAGR